MKRMRELMRRFALVITLIASLLIQVGPAAATDLPNTHLPGPRGLCSLAFPQATQSFDFGTTFSHYGELKRVALFLNHVQLSPNVLPAATAPLPGNALPRFRATIPFRIDVPILPDGTYHLTGQAVTSDESTKKVFDCTFWIDRAPRFADVPMGDWAHRYVDLLGDQGIILGANGLFDPSGIVTRGQFAAMIARSLYVPSGPSPMPVGHALTGTDLAADWAAGPILALNAEEIILGEPGADGTTYFYPDRPLTRAEASTILYRAMRINGLQACTAEPTDLNQAPTWAQAYIMTLACRGVIKGFPDGSFRPGQTLHRDEAATLIAKMQPID